MGIGVLGQRLRNLGSIFYIKYKVEFGVHFHHLWVVWIMVWVAGFSIPAVGDKNSWVGDCGLL